MLYISEFKFAFFDNQRINEGMVWWLMRTDEGWTFTMEGLKWKYLQQ